MAQQYKTKYPYDKWADGNVWRLQRGVDFNRNPRDFRMAIRYRFWHTHDVKWKRVEPDVYELQLVPKEGT